MHNSNPISLVSYPTPSTFNPPSLDTSPIHSPSLKRPVPPSPTEATHSGFQRPAKRSRKAINCEPCRASKLKCDRGRPCSGCVLRGTTSSCYADSLSNSEDGSGNKLDDYGNNPRIDPQAEITRIRNSLLVIENHINRNNPLHQQNVQSSTIGTRAQTYNSDSRRSSITVNAVSPASSPAGESPPSTSTVLMKLPDDPPPEDPGADPSCAPFFGATSVACTVRLLSLRDSIAGSPRELGHNKRQHGDGTSADGDGLSASPATGLLLGDELLEVLPDLAEVERLANQYFTGCGGASFRAIHGQSFWSAWDRFKSTSDARRGGNIFLATLFAVLAVAMAYSITPDMGHHYYAHSEQAYSRFSRPPPPSLEHLEYLLLRVQYLELVGDMESVWAVRTHAVGVAQALGLHRDPGRWISMPELERERRRLGWWNTLWVDRWFSFLLGRPPSIQNAHFDTTFPSSSFSSPSQVTTFRLAHLLGAILDDFASATGGLSSERVWAQDKALQGLLNALDVGDRAALLHVRMALHRAVVLATPCPLSSGLTADDNRAKSLEMAVRSAELIIQLYAAQCGAATTLSPSSLKTSPSCPPTPSPMTTSAPISPTLTTHAFSAALFLASIMIHPPPSPVPAPVRSTLRVALHAFGTVKDNAAEKAWRVLGSMKPLWEEGGCLVDKQRRAGIWALVKTFDAGTGMLSSPSREGSCASSYTTSSRPSTSLGDDTPSPGGGITSVPDAINFATSAFLSNVAATAAPIILPSLPSTTASSSSLTQPEDYFDMASYEASAISDAWHTSLVNYPEDDWSRLVSSAGVDGERIMG